jgi:hypothetical protein
MVPAELLDEDGLFQDIASEFTDEEAKNTLKEIPPEKRGSLASLSKVYGGLVSVAVGIKFEKEGYG